MHEPQPSTGFRSIKDHWKEDILAAISVSLVALPLALGIALASGAPPMSGLLAAIIGGVVTTFFRGSHVAINGPAAGLIVVILTGVETLADENGSGFPYVLAAIVVAGLIQVLLGLLKMGKLGDLFPTSVVHGMLATIGITIFIKQFHIALGVNSNTGSTLNSLMEIPNSLQHLNPTIALISIISLVILVIHPRITNRFLKGIPGPLQVLIVVIPLVFMLNYFSEDLWEVLYIGPEYLVSIPENMIDSIIFPNFSKILLPEFWLLVISITLVASIETLISTKAVDKLDHYKRRTNLSKDLMAVGLSSAVSGLLGGLPIITVIVRSSINVNHNAKTRMSNLYHGIILAALIFLFPFLINEIPLACLAAILVYTGYKLASPKVFKAALLKGWEQLFILVATLVASLTIDLLWGIIIGIVVTLMVHWFQSQLHIKTFFRHLIQTEISVEEETGEVVYVEIKGIANFAIILKLINSLKDLKMDKHFIVNFSRTKLVDSTVLDFIYEHREKYFTNSSFDFIGLDVHRTSSPHPLALHVLEKPMQKRMTNRQIEIYRFSKENNYNFSPEINWETNHFQKFRFIEHHLLEYHRNRLSGSFEGGYDWRISDLTYNDGILMAREEHNITLMVIFLPKTISSFSIIEEVLENIEGLDIKKKKSLKKAITSNDPNSFIISNASYYIEGIDRNILIYRKERLLSAKEIEELHDFAKKYCNCITKTENFLIELDYGV